MWINLLIFYDLFKLANNLSIANHVFSDGLWSMEGRQFRSSRYERYSLPNG